jgi:hypothetical protein
MQTRYCIVRPTTCPKLDKTQKEIAMKKLMLGTITALFALSMGSPAFAQQHMPRGTATDVTND